MVFLQMTVAALLPVLLSVLFTVAEKKQRWKQAPYWKKQVLIGIAFGALACFATEFGIKTHGVVMNVRNAAPLTAGLLFGGPAGVLAGVIGCVHRVLSTLWNENNYSLVACALGTLLAGVIGAACRKFMFDSKNSSWFYGLIIGMGTEVLHMLLLFVTKADDIQRTFTVVRSCTIPMVVANGFSVMLSLLLAAKIGGSEKDMRRQKQLTQTFSVALFVCVIAAFVCTSIFTFVFQNRIGNASTDELLAMNIRDVKLDIMQASDKYLLDVTYAIRDELAEEELDTKIEKDTFYLERVLHRPILQNLAKKYHVTDINLVNRNGIILLSNFPRFELYNMGTVQGGQAEEFLCLNHGTQEYVQDYRPTDADPHIYRKYAGVALPKGGFLQVGYDAASFQDAIAKNVTLAAANRHVGREGFMLICKEDTSEIVSTSNATLSKELLKNLKTLPNEERFQSETADGEAYFCMAAHSEGYVIVAAVPRVEAYFTRDLSTYIGIFMQVIVFLCLFVLIYTLIRRIVCDNIQRINVSLKKITDGDLDEQVNIRDHEEFSNLSDGINTTVTKLKDSIAEAEARIDKELEFAKAIQHSSLPSVFPPYPNRTEFDIYARMDTAKEVGGDFYDLYLLGDDLIFLVADVSGKGIPAALFMMKAKTQIKGLAEAGHSMDEIFTLANEKLCENNDAEMFVTAWMGKLNLKTGRLEYVNAGHNPPLMQLNGEDFQYVKCRPGFVLAGLEGIKYRKNEMQLHAGDRIFLYTDGVTEATDLNNELYGEDRLREMLNANRNLEVSEICGAVKTSVDEFAGEAPQFDDITMLALYYKGGHYKMKELTIDATIEHIETVTDFVNEQLEAFECPIKAQTQIDIAIDELFGNIAHYAYDPDVGPATVRVEVLGDPITVIITFIDHGVPYDPLKKEDPDITLSAEERDIGGLGIYIVKQSMDEITYEYKDGQNILRIKKKI